MTSKIPDWIIPQVTLAILKKSALYALGGGLLAGGYGMVHDAITYRIGPTYFEDFKFEQFQWADLGWPRPWFAVAIGFLASWWVGFAATYFLARYAVPQLGTAAAPAVRRAILTMIACAVAAFGLSYLAGRAWAENEFQQVAWIHNSGYAGAFLGLLLGLWGLRRRVNREKMKMSETLAL